MGNSARRVRRMWLSGGCRRYCVFLSLRVPVTDVSVASVKLVEAAGFPDSPEIENAMSPQERAKMKAMSDRIKADVDKALKDSNRRK